MDQPDQPQESSEEREAPSEAPSAPAESAAPASAALEMAASDEPALAETAPVQAVAGPPAPAEADIPETAPDAATPPAMPPATPSVEAAPVEPLPVEAAPVEAAPEQAAPDTLAQADTARMAAVPTPLPLADTASLEAVRVTTAPRVAVPAEIALAETARMPVASPPSAVTPTETRPPAATPPTLPSPPRRGGAGGGESRALSRRLLLTLGAALALVCVLVGLWGAFQLAPPGGARAGQVVNFQVVRGDSSAAVAARLVRLGLVRDARLFELDATLRGLDAHLAPGVYHLSPSMGADALASRLARGQPDAQLITIAPGLRATQYPALLAPLLPRFDAAAFLRIAQTGTLPDGTSLASRYWYVPPRAAGVPYALEGYLAPGTYLIPATASAPQVAEQLVASLGERLCPGPDSAHRDAYLADAAACAAHAAPVGAGASRTNILSALEARFGTADPRAALHDGLTLASLVARAAPRPEDAVGITGIASVYYNRYQAWATGGSDPAGDAVQQLDAPASAQYARDSDTPPANGAWWTPLTGDPAQVDPASPYNSSAPGHAGLIPGPIAAASWQDLAAVATASSPSYYFATACGTAFFATSAAETQGVAVKTRYLTANGCPANQVLTPGSDPAAAPGGDQAVPRLARGTLPPAPAISAAYAYLMNPLTGQVLFAQDAQSEHPMASTTKLMTALVAVTYGNLDQRITVGQDIHSLDGTGASLAGLQPGETLTLRELIEALLLPSGDDAGVVIADGIAGSQAGFVWLMNDEARVLGLTHTHYANPHGLDQDGHYTSAADLAWLTAFALKNPVIAQAVATPEVTVPATADHGPFDWVNTNELLFPPVYPGIVGVKTGYTGGAGACLVFAARGPGGMLIGVVLNDPTHEDRFSDARALLDWGFAAESRLRTGRGRVA